MEKAFSIGESLEFGWHKTRDHSRLLFQILLTLFALQVIQEIVNKVLQNTFTGALANLALLFVSIVVGAGFTRILLKLAQGHATHYQDLVPPGRLVWHFFCASLLAGVAIALGFIALIIPGVYLLLRFSMVRFAVVDGADIVESLRQSGKATDGHKWQLFGFFLVLLGVNIVGFLLLFVGLLVTIPLTGLAWAHVYLKLKKSA